VSLARDATGEATPKPDASYAVVGRSAPRRDLPAKLTGAAYVTTWRCRDGARPRLRPSYSARLASFDADAVRAAPGVVAVVVNGSFVRICAERRSGGEGARGRPPRALDGRRVDARAGRDPRAVAPDEG
jgi:hypothetical protein